MIFHDFLKSQYSEENLLFWLAVEKLKKETDQAAVKELAQSIYRDYLSAESPKEVSNNVYRTSYLWENYCQIQSAFFSEYAKTVLPQII